MAAKVDTVNRADYYYNGSYTVTDRVSDQKLDLNAALKALGRASLKSDAHYLKLTTDKNITVKLNNTSYGEIPLLSATPLIFDQSIKVVELYFTHGGGASGSGDASITILAI